MNKYEAALRFPDIVNVCSQFDKSKESLHSGQNLKAQT